MTTKKSTLHEEIAAYAAEFAGTEFDLDEELEAASIEHLLADQFPLNEFKHCTSKACIFNSPKSIVKGKNSQR